MILFTIKKETIWRVGCSKPCYCIERDNANVFQDPLGGYSAAKTKAFMSLMSNPFRNGSLDLRQKHKYPLNLLIKKLINQQQIKK